MNPILRVCLESYGTTTPETCGEKLKGGALFQVLWHKSPKDGDLRGAEENGTMGHFIIEWDWDNNGRGHVIVLVVRACHLS